MLFQIFRISQLIVLYLRFVEKCTSPWKCCKVTPLGIHCFSVYHSVHSISFPTLTFLLRSLFLCPGASFIDFPSERLLIMKMSYSKSLLFFFFFGLFFFRATLATYGGSQARSPIGAVAAGLCQSHRSRVCDLYHSSWQHQNLNPLSDATDQTCVLMDASRVC